MLSTPYQPLPLLPASASMVDLPSSNFPDSLSSENIGQAFDSLTPTTSQQPAQSIRFYPEGQPFLPWVLVRMWSVKKFLGLVAIVIGGVYILFTIRDYIDIRIGVTVYILNVVALILIVAWISRNESTREEMGGDEEGGEVEGNEEEWGEMQMAGASDGNEEVQTRDTVFAEEGEKMDEDIRTIMLYPDR